MLMQKLSVNKCPVCGCTEIVKEVREKPHINGYFNEYRGFRCGYAITFCPNFVNKNNVVAHTCDHDPDVKTKRNSRLHALNSLERYIKRYLNVDVSFKDRLIKHIKEVHIS